MKVDFKAGYLTMTLDSKEIKIIPGIDRPYTPVRIEFDGEKPMDCKVGLIEVVKTLRSIDNEDKAYEYLISVIDNSSIYE